MKGLSKSSIQGEFAFCELLEKMGAKVDYQDDSVTVSKNKLKGMNINVDHATDTGMTLAIVALFAEGKTKISGISNWRVKETDRIEAMHKELSKVGAHIESGDDWIEITPPKEVEGFKTAEIETYNDHRMAMCFSLLSLAQIPITILNPQCCEKTYPNYFEDFEKIVN